MIVCLGSVQSSPAPLIHSSLAATVRWENKYVGNNSNGGNGWWFEYWIFRERVGTRGTCGGIWLNIVEYFSQNKIFFGGYFCCVFFWCIIGCFKMIIIKLRYNYDAKTFYSTIHYLRNEHGWGAFFTKAKTSLKALTNCKVLLITLVISTTDWHGSSQ